MDAKQFADFMKIQQKILETISSSTSTGASGSANFQVSANSALVPNFEMFDTTKESFRNYKLRFENYTRMKNVHKNKEYCVNLLLNSMGAKSFNIATALAAPKDPSELTYDELVALLQEHLSPQQNVLVAQHQFLSKYQSETESITEYVAALRTDMGDCKFYCSCKLPIADIFLRAQFIRGIKDGSIREQLLQNHRELTTFSDIVAKAIVLEAAKTDSKELGQKSTQSKSGEINKVTGKASKFNQNSNRKVNQFKNKRNKHGVDFKALGLDGLCLRCGKNNHYAKDCLSKSNNLKCSECKQTGHVAKVCIKARMNKSNHEQIKS